VSSVVLLDISRLIWRARRRAPTGIDRVELAYAQHFLADRNECPAYPVVHLFGFLFALSPAGGRRFVRALTERWEGSSPPNWWANLKSVLKIYRHLLTSWWLFGPALRLALWAQPGQPVFVVASSHHLGRASALTRLRHSLGVRTVCLIHDLLALDYPEYFWRGWESRYQNLSSNLARYFDGVITNSEATTQSLRTYLHSEPLRPAIRTALLGSRVFPRTKTGNDHPAPERPYFVIFGTIEPRKNHLLLLNLWARLASTMPQPPRLLVIGARGWENEQVLDMLERSRRLRGLVEEHNGLSDVEVGPLLQGARALLMPSFAEGFGLPLAEALASGVPAICSDLPVFREFGHDVPEYLDPLDLKAWGEAVLDYCSADSRRRAEQMQRLEHWQAPRWADHFTLVEALIADVAATERPALPAATRLATLPENG